MTITGHGGGEALSSFKYEHINGDNVILDQIKNMLLVV